MPRNFQFIHVTGELKLDDEKYRKAVRSSAMRAWRQKERIQQMTEHRLQLQALRRASREDTNALIRSDTSEFLQLRDDAAIQSSIARSSSLGMGSVDPFMVMALSLPSSYQGLIHHFATRIGTMITPVGDSTSPEFWTQVWMKHAISSPVLILATCCHASTHLASFTNDPTDLTWVKLRSATIEMIQKSLQDESTMASDETFAAVALLAADSFIVGSAEEITHHMSALQRLAELRGPTHALGFNGIIGRMIATHTAPARIRTRTTPIKSLPSPSPLSTPSSPPLLFAPSTSTSARAPLLDDLIRQTRALMSTLDPACPVARARDLSTQLHFFDARSALEIELVARCENWRADEAATPADDVVLVTAAALLTYVFCHLRSFTVRALTVKGAARDLGEAILRVDEDLLTGLWEGEWRWLVWAVVVASQVCVGLENEGVREKSKRLFGRAREALGLRTVEEVRDLLRESVVWTEDAWTRRLEDEIRGTMGL